MTDKQPSKADKLREMREARHATRSNPFQDAARGRDPINPVAKATEAKPSGLDAKGPSKTPVTPADRVASRLGAGRTAQDSPRPETVGAVAILKRGRPKIEGLRPWEAAGMSRRSWYRRQAEAKSK